MASLFPLAVINTVHWRRSDDPTDDLTGYDTVLTVIRDSGLLPDLEPLRQGSSDDPEGARRAVAELIRWRERAYSFFVARDERRPAPASYLRGLSRLVAEAHAHRRLTQTAGGYAIAWVTSSDLRLPLWLFALTTAEALAGDLSHRVKLCPGDGCGWIFLDQSPNLRRVWCSGAVCGNRARARRHYARQPRS